MGLLHTVVPSWAADLPHGLPCQFASAKFFVETSSDEVTLWSEEFEDDVQTNTEKRIRGWGVGDYA
jgi:hypothetical protein